jgi:hypothetical protein
MSDLAKAFEAIQGKQSSYETLWSYYSGEQPLRYSTERLREVFSDINAHFAQNWCAVVVDSVLDRLVLSGLTVAGDEAASARLSELWSQLSLDLEADDVHQGTLVCGDGVIIAWREPDGEIQAFYNDAHMIHIEYAASNPRQMLWAAKQWIGDDEHYRIVLYYPDRLEYFVGRGKTSQTGTAGGMMADTPDVAPNPFGQVPFFHFRRERRAIRSEFANALPLQDAINKLLADMMVAAEFGAFRQRYIISQADPGNLKNAPNENWWIPAGDGQGQGASAGEFSPSDLGNYMNGMKDLAASISIITRTPKHYFMTQGGDPSGEALIAMESPLVKKVKRYMARFAPPWKELASFLLKLDGREVPADAIQLIYEKPETVQPKAQAEVRKLKVETGMPLTTVLRAEGWTAEQLATLEQDKLAQQAQSAQGLAQALLNRQRQFDQGG